MNYSEKLELLCKKLNISQTEREKLLSLNHTTVGQIEEMLRGGTSAREIADMLGKNGIEADTAKIEELLAKIQAQRAQSICEPVDLDQLKQVTGGWCAFWQEEQGNLDTCTNRFKNYDTTDPGWMYVVCLAVESCDQHWDEVPRW